MDPQKPNLVSRGFFAVSNLLGLIGQSIQSIADIYIVSVNVSKHSDDTGDIPVEGESSHTMYLLINDDGTSDFVHEMNRATPVKFLRGHNIVKVINEKFKLQVEGKVGYDVCASLITYNDAALVNEVATDNSTDENESQ